MQSEAPVDEAQVGLVEVFGREPAQQVQARAVFEAFEERREGFSQSRQREVGLGEGATSEVRVFSIRRPELFRLGTH